MRKDETDKNGQNVERRVSGAHYGVKSLSETGILTRERKSQKKKKCKGESDLDYELLTPKKNRPKNE